MGRFPVKRDRVRMLEEECQRARNDRSKGRYSNENEDVRERTYAISRDVMFSKVGI